MKRSECKQCGVVGGNGWVYDGWEDEAPVSCL
jgi:hypothetical protein